MATVFFFNYLAVHICRKMKRYLLIFLIFPLLLSGCRTPKMTTAFNVMSVEPTNEQVAVTDVPESNIPDFRDASTWILGDFLPDRLRYSDHSSWYINGFDEYVPDQTIIGELKNTSIDNLTVTVVLGTWCPDSRREVPRFMKIINLWGLAEDKIRFIGVDINKVAPLEDYAQLDIVRVPTFIFYKNNLEAGRIIEVPITSLEQDIRDILRR